MNRGRIRHKCPEEVKDTLCGVVYCKADGGALLKISIHTCSSSYVAAPITSMSTYERDLKAPSPIYDLWKKYATLQCTNSVDLRVQVHVFLLQGSSTQKKELPTPIAAQLPESTTFNS